MVAKSASFQLKGRNLSPAEIGRRLDARYLLEGSVRRAGDRVRVTTELSEAATGQNVWSQAYDAEVKDIFSVQEDIARRVVGAAAVELTRFERDRALAKPTKSLAAYEYVLRGREVLSRSTRDMNDEAQDMFQRAIALDPSYATAYAGLGGTYYEAVVSGWTEFRGEELERAENLAQKALALDPASTSAYRLLALIDLSKGRYDFALGQIATRSSSIRAMPRAICGAAPFCCFPGDPRKPCPGSKARFASIPTMGWRPCISAWPIISWTGMARPSKRWTAPSPGISDVSTNSWGVPYWRPPMLN